MILRLLLLCVVFAGNSISLPTTGLAFQQASESLLPEGNHRRGRALFAQRGCAACHAVDGKTASLGPDLSKPENDKPFTRAEFLEAVNEPSKKIRKGYDAFSVLLDSGKVTTGRIVKETD